jgi:hypothetical protein
MFERFLSAFPPDTPAVMPPNSEPRLAGVAGYAELARIGSGITFGDGVLRVHSHDESLRARRLVASMFREYADVVPIAKDWLGRQFALDFAGVGAGAPRLLLIEPGSAEAFDVECGITQLFDVEMVDDPATFLATDLFAGWRRAGGETPLSSQCVGFKVPLFLGGEGDVSNLELSDEDVYWTLMGQLSRS